VEKEEEKMGKCFTPSGFSLQGFEEKTLKLEIGAGDGEWVVHQAPKDVTSVWAAVELRYDKCARIWSQMCLEGIDNLVVLGGDAQHVVSKLAQNTVSEVVCFYPEPPAWHEGAWEDKFPLHVWTKEFLAVLSSKMRLSGLLTICSDNKKYLELIKSNCPETFVASDGETIEVRSGRIGKSDTYFDRLWKQGKKKKRYHLSLRRM